MEQGQSESKIILFLLSLWLIFIVFSIAIPDLLLSPVSLLMFIITYLALAVHVQDVEADFFDKLTTNSIWIAGITFMMVAVWTVFGIAASIIMSGSVHSSLSQEQLDSRVFTICLPGAFFLNIVLMALGLSQIKASSRRIEARNSFERMVNMDNAYTSKGDYIFSIVKEAQRTGDIEKMKWELEKHGFKPAHGSENTYVRRKASNDEILAELIKAKHREKQQEIQQQELSFCPHCGSKVQPSDNNCPQCGIKIGEPEYGQEGEV